MPGKDSVALVGADQIALFERLVAAEKAGSPDVQVKELMDGLGSRSPQQAFRADMWESLLNVYISKGAKRGYWRLVTTALALESAPETPVEEPV